MNKDYEVAYFDIDEGTWEVKNYTIVTKDREADWLYIPFRDNVVNPTVVDLLDFFEERLIPSTRHNIDEVLESYGLNIYDPIKFMHATHGIMFEDFQWVRFDDEELTFKDVDHFGRLAK